MDPSGGLSHLQQRQLVALSEANLLADPLRLLRGIRLASSLGFALEPSSAAWIQSHGAQLTTVAGERVLAELTKLAAAQQGERGLAQALAWNLLQGWGADASANLAGLSLERARQRGLLEGEIEWALPLARICALLPPQALAGLRSSNRLQQRCRALRHWQQQVAQVGCWANLPEPSCLALQRQLEADFPALVLLLAEPAPSCWSAGATPPTPCSIPAPPSMAEACSSSWPSPPALSWASCSSTSAWSAPSAAWPQGLKGRARPWLPRRAGGGNAKAGGVINFVLSRRNERLLLAC